MDTLANLLNKALENINKLNDELYKLKSSHINLSNKYIESCKTIVSLETRISNIEKCINPEIALDQSKLESLIIKICQENPMNLGPKGPVGDKGEKGDTGPVGPTGQIGPMV